MTRGSDIILTKNKDQILVDKDILLQVRDFSWCVNQKNGYPQNRYKKKLRYLHRLVMKFPKQRVDHINGNKLDNRRCNLRTCTQSQNMANSKVNNSNTSGFKGVSWSKVMRKWESRIMYNYKSYVLGYFIDKEEAAMMYNLIAIELFGEFASSN